MILSLHWNWLFFAMSTPGAWTEDRIRALREKEDLPFVLADASGIVQGIHDRSEAGHGVY